MLEFHRYYEHCLNLYLLHRANDSSAPTPCNIGIEIDRLYGLYASEKNNGNYHGNWIEKQLLTLDNRWWTDAVEYIDREDYPIEKKREIVFGLHMKNSVFATYKKIFAALLPDIRRVNGEHHSPYRILEIAAGQGFLSKSLLHLADRHHVTVDIVCSDVVGAYLDNDGAVKSASSSSLEFMVVDALDLTALTPGPEDNKPFDLMLTLHSMHHFTPVQLGRIIEGSQRICRDGIIAVDGCRTLGNIVFTVGTAALPSLAKFTSCFVHDAVISARKMYPLKQLEGIATIACPGSAIKVERLSLGLNCLRVKPAP